MQEAIQEAVDIVQSKGQQAVRNASFAERY